MLSVEELGHSRRAAYAIARAAWEPARLPNRNEKGAYHYAAYPAADKG